MDIYRPPLADIHAALDLVGLAELAKLPGFEHADPDTVDGLLGEFARFVTDAVLPLDRVGDQQGSRLDAKAAEVTTPEGYPAMYRAWVDAGWGSVPFAPEHGGGGFPWLVGVAMQEILGSANLAFSLCPLLTQGGIELVSTWGTEQQQAEYLPRLIAGEWTGTMVLTEPEAGSDLGALRTIGAPAGDGSWRLRGTKIFITWGEHDLAENIVHLVIARTPDAPPGTRGLSVFVVPKILPGGERNRVRCVGIEHKLGIHASPTCVMEFDDAIGYLVGPERGGMRAMFTMMNNARLLVGLEGLSVAERSYQQALDHASTRKQGRVAGAAEPVAIVEHPDVRRMLLHVRSHVEAMRLLVYTNAHALDVAHHHPDEAERAAGQALADLLTPISKAWCTDLGVEMASICLQVHGGMGFVEETGIAQRYRDVRISPIYEGTNGIQAIDLVTRKLPLGGGAVVGGLLDDIAALDDQLAAAGDDLAPVRSALREALDALREATDWMQGRLATDPADALAGASSYLRLAGNVVGGWLLAKQAVASPGRAVSARYFADHVLPHAPALARSATAGRALLDAASL